MGSANIAAIGLLLVSNIAGGQKESRLWVLVAVALYLVVVPVITSKAIARVRNIPSAPKGAAMIVWLLVSTYPPPLEKIDEAAFLDEKRRYIGQLLLSWGALLFGSYSLLRSL